MDTTNANLLKTTSTLDLDNASILEITTAPPTPSTVTYSRDRDETPRSVTVDWETFDDLGRPAAITVTIEPGDKLNP